MQKIIDEIEGKLKHFDLKDKRIVEAVNDIFISKKDVWSFLVASRLTRDGEMEYRAGVGENFNNFDLVSTVIFCESWNLALKFLLRILDNDMYGAASISRKIFELFVDYSFICVEDSGSRSEAFIKYSRLINLLRFQELFVDSLDGYWKKLTKKENQERNELLAYFSDLKVIKYKDIGSEKKIPFHVGRGWDSGLWKHGGRIIKKMKSIDLDEINYLVYYNLVSSYIHPSFDKMTRGAKFVDAHINTYQIGFYDQFPKSFYLIVGMTEQFFTAIFIIYSDKNSLSFPNSFASLRNNLIDLRGHVNFKSTFDKLGIKEFAN